MKKTKKVVVKKQSNTITQVKAKTTLCIKAEDLTKFKEDMTSVEFHLLNRDDSIGEDGIEIKGCEQDPTYLQIIPYVLFTKSINNVAFFLTYSRDTKSNETRLVHKRSLGFGGHIDTLPATKYSISKHIFEEVAREIKEELNYDVNVDKLISQYSNPNNKTPLIFIEPDHTSEEVSRVHLGILVNINVEEKELDNITLEEGHIAGLKWSPLGELKEKTVFQRNVQHQYLKEVYEEWSVRVIDMITISQQ